MCLKKYGGAPILIGDPPSIFCLTAGGQPRFQCGHWPPQPDSTVPKPGNCGLFDVDRKKNDYYSDMARAFFYQSAGEKNREAYEVVLKTNLTAQAAIKPGMKFCGMDKSARDIITDPAMAPILPTGRAAATASAHGAGDVSSIAAKEGMIFSCEPGICLPGAPGVRIGT